MKAYSLIVVSILISGCASQPSTDLSTDAQKASYAMGYSTGLAIKPGIAASYADTEAFLSAFTTAMRGDEDALLMTKEEMEEAESSYQAVISAKRQEERERQAVTNKEQGDIYRSNFASQDGVTSLDNGILYKEIKNGSGRQKPKLEDTVIAHYHGTLVDGSVFDSSVQRGEPVTFPINRVIKGWQEVLPLMNEGDKWQVVIPPELAYGEQGTGQKIGPNATLVFEIEILEINE